MYVNDDQTIYVADAGNHRIVQWEYGATSGKIVAGGDKEECEAYHLKWPIDVIVDNERNYLIISDHDNRRVVRWSSRRSGIRAQSIISNIDCSRLTIDRNEYLYVSDKVRNEVRRWKIGDTHGTLVAGGNGKGNRLNQLNWPTFIVVDEDQSVYISDRNNHRVMKWLEGAKEGIIVAGGQGEGNGLSQLAGPRGVIVDHFGTVYVADYDNHRIMRWYKGATEGTIVVGGHGKGNQANQLNHPQGLSFDRQGNLYVVDQDNDRVQRYDIDRS
jgi:sugar lactone lactonase YvrE